jgi:hypothetical protein
MSVPGAPDVDDPGTRVGDFSPGVRSEVLPCSPEDAPEALPLALLFISDFILPDWSAIAGPASNASAANPAIAVALLKVMFVSPWSCFRWQVSACLGKVSRDDECSSLKAKVYDSDRTHLRNVTVAGALPASRIAKKIHSAVGNSGRMPDVFRRRAGAIPFPYCITDMPADHSDFSRQ